MASELTEFSAKRASWTNRIPMGPALSSSWRGVLLIESKNKRTLERKAPTPDVRFRQIYIARELTQKGRSKGGLKIWGIFIFILTTF